jgi:hypothetical protein
MEKRVERMLNSLSECRETFKRAPESRRDDTSALIGEIR